MPSSSNLSVVLMDIINKTIVKYIYSYYIFSKEFRMSNNEMNERAETSEKGTRLEMYGGKWGALVPLVVTLALLVWFSINERGDVTAFWVAIWLGLFAGLFLAKDKRIFSETLIEGIQRREGVVIFAVWIFAGVFGALLSNGGLTSGMLWFGLESGTTGVVFILLAYLAAMLTSLGLGTSVGTLIALVPVMYPAGVMLGSNPWVLAVALLAGAAFGDNLSPVSDTTIVSSMAMEAEIGDVVASRAPLAIVAAIIGGIMFAITGVGGGEVTGTGQLSGAETQAVGLLQFISLGIVIAAALAGRHLIEALTWGNLSAMIIGVGIGAFQVSDILRMPAERGGDTGLIQEGIASVVTPIIFVMIILALLQIIINTGLMDDFIEWATSFVADNIRSGELSTIAIAILASIPLAANVPAILLSADYGQEIADRYNIHRARAANLIDCSVCTLFYMLPWHNAVIVWYAMVTEASQEYGLPAPPITSAFTNWYAWALLGVLIVAAVTGWNRSYADESISYTEVWTRVG